MLKKFTFLGKVYEFGENRIVMFNMYIKNNGKLIKTSKQMSPILKTNRSYLEYIVLLEEKGYVSIKNFKEEK